jgi:hypothetical protein
MHPSPLGGAWLSDSYLLKLIDFLLSQDVIQGNTNPEIKPVNILTKPMNFDG